jgi:hypothetical protein
MLKQVAALGMAALIVVIQIQGITFAKMVPKVLLVHVGLQNNHQQLPQAKLLSPLQQLQTLVTYLHHLPTQRQSDGQRILASSKVTVMAHSVPMHQLTERS